MKSSETVDENINSEHTTHEEVINLIDEIIAYESEYPIFIVKEPKKIVKEEIIEITPEVFNEDNPLPLKDEQNNIFSSFFKKHLPEFTINPTVIKFKLDESGELVYTDRRISEPSEKKKIKFDIKKLLKRGKGKSDKKEAGEKEASSGKLGKITSVFGKFSKLKKVIPSKDGKEESGESKTEE